MDLSLFFGLPPLPLLIAFMASAGLLALFFVFWYRRESRRADYREKVSLEGKSPKWIEKKAAELVKIEAFRLAGDLYAHQGKWPEAAGLYRKGGDFVKAAEAFISAGRPAEAAAALLENKDYERAAQLFIENGAQAEAARALLTAGETVRAAQLFERAGLPERAAEIFSEQGLYRRAAEMFRKKGMSGPAADALWRCQLQERGRLPAEVTEADSMPLRLLARQAGEMFREAGRLDEAAEAFAAGGWSRERAETLKLDGKTGEAAEAFLEAGELEPAAEAFAAAGDERRAARLRAELHLAAGHEREAAGFLETAGEWARAAELRRKFGQWADAGRCFEAGGDFALSAEMYEKAEDFARAAECRSRAGDHRAAAVLYGRAGNPGAQAEALEKAGEFVAAGANYFERGLLDKAITVLQQVEADAPDYPVASLLLGQIFREKGILELAHQYFRRSIKDQELSRGNLESYYQLALTAERMGKTEEAAGVYEKILALDFHFKDVADRINALRSSRTQVETPSAPTSYDATVSGGRPISGGTPAPRPAIDPNMIGHYQKMSELGRGGMGIVYKAKDTTLERTVALKMLPSNLKDHPQAVKNFQREARSAAQLSHPHIVTIYELGEYEGNYYIAMEYVEGQTIKDILNRDGKMPLRAVLLVAGQVCRALEYAHDRRIVHRDIKCSNIMWTPDRQVKLMDFGLAKMIEEVKGYQTIASGTPYYMSPEQVLGRNIDHRTDLYSLGVTLFEMSTGRLPFHHGDASYHHVHTPPPAAITVNPTMPEALSNIILKLMQKNPDDRYPNARELFNALRQVTVT